jgi:hypothetical protein
MSPWNLLAPSWLPYANPPEDDEWPPRAPAPDLKSNPFSSLPTLDPSVISALLERLPPPGYFLDPHRWNEWMPDYQTNLPSGLFNPAEWTDPPAPSGIPSSLPSAPSLPPSWLQGALFGVRRHRARRGPMSPDRRVRRSRCSLAPPIRRGWA